MSERKGNNWHGYIDGQTPVQGCGLVDGYPWYFRARFDYWSMEIAKDKSIDCEILPLVGMSCSGWLVESNWGNCPEAGYMDEEIAWSLIESTIENFRANELEFIYFTEKK